MQNGAINIAIKAARAAGQVIMRSLPKRDSLPIIEKAQNDFATEVDRAAELTILRELKRAFPTHAFLAEESGAAGKSRYVWVVDPLDGTSNFIRGFPHFSVSIALTYDNDPILGVVYDPLRDELFAAEKGRGAVHNDRKLRIGTRKGLEGCLLTTGFPFREKRHMDAHMAMTKSLMGQAEDIRRTGSAALDLAYVACGRFDGYYELGLKPWDMAAGVLLVREAGGKCWDFRGGQNFMDTGNIVAGNLKVGEDMLKTIEPHLTITM